MQGVKGTFELCAVDACGRKARGRGLCNLHYKRQTIHGDPTRTARRGNGEGTPHISGYWFIKVNGVQRLRHVLIAEKALGKPLPKGAEVHHFDEDRSNDSPHNLVICPSRSYHKLLHRRQNALNACGNADWIHCWLCGRYSDPATMIKVNRASYAHADCQRQYNRTKRRKP